MANSSNVTVTAKGDFPYCYTCLLCGAENKGTFHIEASRGEVVNSAGRKEHVRDINDAKMYMGEMASNQVNEYLNYFEKATKTFSSYWEECSKGKPEKLLMHQIPIPYRIANKNAFKCRQCDELQPYILERYKTNRNKLGAGLLITALFTFLLAVAFIIIYLLDTARVDAAVFLMISIVTAPIGLVSLIIGAIISKKAREAVRVAQYEELHKYPYMPMKLPKVFKEA